MFETFYRILPSVPEIKAIPILINNFQLSSLEELIKRKENIKSVAVLRRQIRKQFGFDNFVDVPDSLTPYVKGGRNVEKRFFRN